jgi:hypothetical protein
MVKYLKTQTTQPKKRRRKKTKNNYFTQVHEDAIVKYQNSTDKKEKELLYKEYIQPAFHEMNKKIVYKFKFNNIPNIDSLMEDLEGELVTLLGKFKPERNKKAFSYYSVIIKNWYIRKSKQNYKKLLTHIAEDSVSNYDHEEFLSIENSYYENRNKDEFIDGLKIEMNRWLKVIEEENDRRVLESIIDLMEQANSIEEAGLIFGKKAIKQVYLPNITGLSTKEINISLNKIKDFYLSFVKSWRGV